MCRKAAKAVSTSRVCPSMTEKASSSALHMPGEEGKGHDVKFRGRVVKKHGER